MKFYLMRHAEAESGDQLDPTRGLTDTGKAQIPIIADFLKTQTNKIKLVMHSEFKRGKDTGEKLANKLGVDTLQHPEIGPAGTPQTAWKIIANALADVGGDNEVVIVTHGPLIHTLAAQLLQSGEGEKFHFSHGSIMHLDTETPLDAESPGPQTCYLHWMVTPKLVNRLVEDDRKAVVEAALRVTDAALKLVRPRSAKLQEAVDRGEEEKQWVGGTCDICLENSGAGWIPIDDDFPSGDDEPPAHPNCMCELETRTAED